MQIAPEWWMAVAETGYPYYHNTTTKETTWIQPVLSAPQPPALPADVRSLDQAMVSYHAGNASVGGGATAYGATPGYGSPGTYGTRAAPCGYGAMQGQGPTTMKGSAGGMPESTAQVQIHQSAGYQRASGQHGSTGGGSLVAQVAQKGTDNQPEVTVVGSGQIPPAWKRWDEVRLPQHIVDAMMQSGFPGPTVIQSHSWPILATGRDFIGIAKTGSGKTLGFLLPGFARMLTERPTGSPTMLVMAPTRELACQIDADAKKFGGPAGVTTALAYGGAPKGPQLADLRRKPHILTGTPGRLNDFIEGGYISLHGVQFLILDEADRMLDMGFEPQIRKVIAQIPSNRQTMMFTATWPKEVRRMATDFFRDPIEVRVGNADELQANPDIDQQVVICRDGRDKERQLLDNLRSATGQVLIFTATKRMCDQLARSLERMGVKCEAIHGDRDQRERDAALGAFKSGASRVLVATDVAARGLDVKSVTLVINFDPASNAEDYVHRIGRTGRAGNKGRAVTLLTQADARAASQIAQVMTRTGKQLPEDLQRMVASVPNREDRRRRSRSRDDRRGRGDDSRFRAF